jgi:PadR family transcriptional regulator PadR
MILLTRSEEIVLVAIWKLGDEAYGVSVRNRVSMDTGRDWSFGAIY